MEQLNSTSGSLESEDEAVGICKKDDEQSGGEDWLNN